MADKEYKMTTWLAFPLGSAVLGLSDLQGAVHTHGHTHVHTHVHPTHTQAWSRLSPLST